MKSRASILCLIGVALLYVPVAAPPAVIAQALKDVQTPGKPLVLKAQGSFFVGGDESEQTRVELGGLGPEGHIAVVLQKGYQTSSLLIRPALVQVARTPKVAEATAATAASGQTEGESAAPAASEASEETQPSGPAP